MDIKDFNIFRFRFFNIKLFGNCRIGLFKESKAPLTENSNFKILERLCEQ